MKRTHLTTLIIMFLILFKIQNAFADIGGLVPCKESPAFQKRLKTSVKKLQQRLNQYESESAPTLTIKQQIDQTETRFTKYGRSNLLCGIDGLPHLVADGRWNHANEFIIPGFGFIYISGWIGWVGRKYLREIGKTKNPSENEIIINVPLAIKIMTTGYIWPLLAWKELVNGNLILHQDQITISPR